MNTPKVSAIVSAYYSAPYLAGRLENLAAQSERPEIIVIAQAGSMDAEIAAEWIRQHPEYDSFSLINTLDIPTIYDAWNMGVKAARGSYLTNANCDDRWYPGALETMAKIMDKHPDIDVLYAEVDILDRIDGEPVGRYRWAEGGFAELLEGCFLGPMPVWRKTLHDRFGWFDGSLRVAGDYEFWLRITQGGAKIEKYHKGPLGAYLKRDDSREHRERIRTLQETARVRSKYRRLLNG